MASTETCDVCCEKYNKSTKKKISCPSCSFNCCRNCIRTYHLGNKDEPHCMKCKSRWNKETFTNATLKSFIDGDYKKHKKDLLFETLVSKLPEAMPAVENHLECIRLSNLKTTMHEELCAAQAIVNKKLKDIRKIDEELFERRTGRYSKKESKEFIKKCSVDGCRGFLSKKWKCNICNKYTCSKCFAVKESGEETKNPDHVCNEDDVKSANLIKKDCRGCPGCGVNIFKISGCDQMWCTECHIAFSWKTGKKVNGIIHNPHFYAWQNSGGALTRIAAPGAVMCGGLPISYDFRILIYEMLDARNEPRYHFSQTCEKQKMAQSIVGMHRAAAHFATVELAEIRRKCNEISNNTDLSIQYTLKQMEDDEVKVELFKRYKNKEKLRTVLDVYELLNTVFTENIRDMYEYIFQNKQKIQINGESQQWKTEYQTLKKNAKEKILENVKNCEKVRIYCNEELKKISVLYSQSVRYVEKNYYTTSKKFKRSDLVS